MGLGFQPLADSTTDNTHPIVSPASPSQEPPLVGLLDHAQECSRAALHAQPMAQYELELEHEEEREFLAIPLVVVVDRAGVPPGRRV